MPKRPGADKKKASAGGGNSLPATSKRTPVSPRKKAAKKKTRSTSRRDMERLFRERTAELRTYQIELELQNEELRIAQLLLEASRRKYADLYDFAPVGYFSFDQNGLITEVNLTGARLLDRDKGSLLSRPFLLFIEPEDRRIFEEHTRSVLMTRARHACELRLQRRDGGVFHAHLESVSDQKAGTDKTAQVRTAVTDITERKRAEESLRQSEERFRVSLQTVPISVTILDRDLRYTWVYNTRHGFRPEQVLGKRADELIEPENAAEVIALQQEALWTRSTIRREIRGMTGDKLWVYDAVAEPVCTDTGEVVGLTFVVLDITERRRADEALRQSEERFRVAQDLSLDAFTILTAVRGDNGAIEDFRWQYVNSRAGTYLRHSPADLVGRRLLHVLPGNKTDSDLFSRYVRVVETGEPHDYELRYESEGISGWFRNMTVKLGDGIAVYFSDITGRKRAENALRRERDKAQQYLNIAETPILAIERDGTVSLINQKGCSILGYAEEDILGRNWFDHFLPEDQRDAIRELFDEIVKGRRQMVEQYENPVLAKDRRLRLISWHNSLVRDESGTISGMLCSGEDITDRKSAETALQESEERNRNLLNFTPLGMLLTRDNRIIWVNPAAVKLFRGLNEQELLAKAPARIFSTPIGELLERHDRGLKRGVPVETQEEKIVTFDGTVREVEVTAVPFLDHRGLRSFSC